MYRSTSSSPKLIAVKPAMAQTSCLWAKNAKLIVPLHKSIGNQCIQRTQRSDKFEIVVEIVAIYDCHLWWIYLYVLRKICETSWFHVSRTLAPFPCAPFVLFGWKRLININSHLWMVPKYNLTYFWWAPFAFHPLREAYPLCSKSIQANPYFVKVRSGVVRRKIYARRNDTNFPIKLKNNNPEASETTRKCWVRWVGCVCVFAYFYLSN